VLVLCKRRITNVATSASRCGASLSRVIDYSIARSPAGSVSADAVREIASARWRNIANGHDQTQARLREFCSG